MNKVILASLIFVSFTSSAFAVGALPSLNTLSSAMSILSLPAENRRMVIHDQGDKYYPHFIAVAFDDKQTMNLRWRALMAAAESRGEKSTSDLLKAGEHKEWYMRNAALIAFEEVNPEQCEKLAIKLLKDKALVVRSAAVNVLGKTKSPATRDLLWEELNQSYNFKNSQSLWIRHQIVEVLAQKPMGRELKVFADLLSDKDSSVQAPAIRGLEKLTGVVLIEGKSKGEKSPVSLWKDYVKKEKIDL